MSRIICTVQTTPDRVEFTWSESGDSFPPYALKGQFANLFREKVVALRERFGELVAIYLDELNGGTTDAIGSESVRRASLELARAGYDLRQRVFQPNDDPAKAARDVTNWVGTLHARGAIESLEVLTDGGPAVPWNALYETKPAPEAFLTGTGGHDHWQGFWGLRYNLAGGQKVDPRRRMPWWNPPRVVLVVDPLVRQGLPKDMRNRLEAFATSRGFTLIGSRAELDKELRVGELDRHRPDLLYWLGHATPENLILGDGPGSEIRPNDLLELLEGDGVPGGLVFLNACRTTQASPTAGSFFQTVFDIKMGGLIATEHQTVDTFAAPLGLDFLEAFLDSGETVGKVMQKLRGRVPLGLLYGTYCPPEIRVVRPATGPTSSAPVVDATAPVPGVALGPGPAREWPPLPSHPYRSLQSYGPEDRALLAGRDEDIQRFALLLDDPSTRLLLLHGESGVGKTSFLRAGVIPYLEGECVGYRFARDGSARGRTGEHVGSVGANEQSGDEEGSILFIRATNDLVTQLATALTKYCGTPFQFQTPEENRLAVDLPAVLRSALGSRTGPDAVRDALREDPGFLGRVLADLAAGLPFTPILVIDQAEEMFTLARTDEDERNRVTGLEVLRRATSVPGGFKLVVSLRTEYHGRLVDRLRKGARDTTGVREYLLTDFGRAALVEAITRPTSETLVRYASQVPRVVYQFRYDAGVAEVIADRVREYTRNRQDSVLPLVQVICGQLHSLILPRSDRTIRVSDLESIGGAEGGTRAHVEGLLKQLFSRGADRRAVKRLLARNLFLTQPDGTLTTALMPADKLKERWTGRMAFEDVLQKAGAGELRLLRLNTLRIGGDEIERQYVSLGHDALAPVAAKWKAQLERWAQLRRYALSTLGVMLILGLAVGIERWVQRRTRAETRVEALGTADTVEVPRMIKDLEEFRDLTGPQLRKLAVNPVNTKPGLHARMALLSEEPGRAGELVEYLLTCRPEELLPIRRVLDPYAAAITPGLWVVLTDSAGDSGKRIRAGCALAGLQPDDSRWEEVAPALAEMVVRSNAVEFAEWSESLESIRAYLLPPLLSRYPLSRRRIKSGKLSESDLVGEASAFDLTAELIAHYTTDRLDDLAELAMTVDARHHRLFEPAIRKHYTRIARKLHNELEKHAFPGEVVGLELAAVVGAPVAVGMSALDPDPVFDALAKRQANAAAVMLILGDFELIWPRFQFPKNGDPSTRSYLIERVAAIGANPVVLIRRFRAELNVSAKRALLIALGDFQLSDGWAVERDVLSKELLTLYREHPDPGLHGAINWLLRQRWGKAVELAVIDEELSTMTRGRVVARAVANRALGTGFTGMVIAASGMWLPAPQVVGQDRDWFVNGEGQTYAVVRGPVEFTLGSPGTEPGRITENESACRTRIERSFAIATKEVTVEQFMRFLPFRPRLWLERYSPDRDGPALYVTWYEAAAYCNWLSEREGIPRDQWCYEPNNQEEYAEGMRIKVGHLKLKGYRLPTEAEWEYACRSGSMVARYFGRSEELLPRYEWYAKQADDHAWPVGRLRPNELGLFDTLGNSWEWTEDPRNNNRIINNVDNLSFQIREHIDRIVCGGAFSFSSFVLRCSTNAYIRPSDRIYIIGIRLSRTIVS